jgi:transcriptional regulator with XRE-family HTH domain
MQMLGGLKLELMRRKMTQRELAKRAGMSESQLSRIVRGDVQCRARLRKLIARSLGLRTKTIFPAQRLCKRAFKRQTQRGTSKNKFASGVCGRSKPGNECAHSRPGAEAARDHKRWPKTSRRSPVSSAEEGPEGSGDGASRPRVGR